MAEIVVAGAGIGGLTAAMLLAKDGHTVTVLERDPEPPPATAEEAWAGWQRKGVSQFRLPHFFLARFRILLEAELPEVLPALDAAGALHINPVAEASQRRRPRSRTPVTAVRASTTLTREPLGWQAGQPGVTDDLGKGHHFPQPP